MQGGRLVTRYDTPGKMLKVSVSCGALYWFEELGEAIS